MKYTDIVTNKRTASKIAWAVFVLCTLIMCSMNCVSNWGNWVLAMLAIHVAILTVLTFHPKTAERVQPFVLTLFSFSNIFVCSIMEHNIYPSIAVFLGAAILISVYKNAKLLSIYILLIVLGLLYHIFVLKTVSFDSSMEIIEFVVRVTVMMTAMCFLLVFIKCMDKNEAEMKKSVEEARQAERYKSDFLANMSHEIRTPMNAIVGMCELILRESGLNESVRENCFNIQTSGRSLLAIINDILDFSKIESGKMELINDEFNIASTLNDVINMSEARRGSKDIELFVEADPDIPCSIIGDEVRIRQVMINLMTNAIKFTEHGSVTLTVSHTKQDYGINLFVAVKDTGIGITEENIEKLFTSFRQVDTKKNRSVEGTGLGLAISKRLIGQMGGFISVSSEYGVGTEFRFVIPLKVKDDRPFAVIKETQNIRAVGFFCGEQYERIFVNTGKRLGLEFSCCGSSAELEKSDATHYFVCKEKFLRNQEFFIAAAKKARVFVVQDRVDAITPPDRIKSLYKPFYSLPVVAALNGENMVIDMNERRGADIHFTAPKARVLIVDDNPINLKVAAGLMRPYNMQLMTAESGRAAIKMLRSRDIDLVFMDHMMPEMDGVEAVQIIRAMEGEYYQKLPIIALTANAVNGARDMFMSSGFNDFLAKPIELSALDRVLRNYLPREYMQSPTSAPYAGVERRKNNTSQQESPAMFDPEKGLSYTGGDIETYREILALYVRKSAEKREHIEELFRQKDWKNYVIEVHALKSTSMSIGAIKLSELAKELEAAGKAESYGIIEKKNDELLRLYGEVSGIASEYLGVTPEENPQVDLSELTEIQPEELEEFIRRAKEACEVFDGDAMTDLAEKTSRFCYHGEPLKNYFGRAAELAEDFEYEAAAEEIARLSAKEGK
ncbi:MAG: response regulator [Oscillospiraceae bacterium]|nr:response regulator [Oscillospiraceae bacterium]